jgi:predicted DNA-binding transcriptional regulator AlpA
MTTRTLAEIEPDASATATVPQLLDGDRIAGLLQVSRRQLSRLVHDGEFPKPIRVGSQPRWLASDYNAYVARLREQQAKRKRHA